MNKKNKFHIGLRTLSVLIDLTFISSISFLLQLLIQQFLDISFLTLYLIIFPIYYLICYYFLDGRTLSKILTGIQIVSKRQESLNKMQLLIREAGKFVFLLIIPVYLINQLSFPISITLLWISIGYIVFWMIISIVLPFFSKKASWELVSSTRMIKNSVTDKSWRVKSTLALISVFVITILFKTYPFISNPHEIKTDFHPEYSNSFKVKKYQDYIVSNAQDPVDYIFDLFEKYDIVVLCERLHSEYTQYELISKIVTDKRFSEKIGNIYTECGTRNFQDTLSQFLNTDYQNEDSLNKATAFIQRNSNSAWPLWTNTNLFDLLKTVNKRNNRLSDSLKINWYFTDVATNWSMMTPINYQKHVRQIRDEAMSNYIVAKYQEKQATNTVRNKGLVIMNFRHGFGYLYNKEITPIDLYPKSINSAAILMDSLPGKVCNVLINTVSLKYGFLFTPIQKGKWDKAFDKLNNPNVGFDLAGSPFGQDEFDMNIGKQVSGLRYQDVFNGFVFYKPLGEHLYKTGFPYMLYNFEDTLVRRAECVSLEYAEKWKKQIVNYKENNIPNGLIQLPELVNLCNGKAEYATLYNLVVNIGFSIIVLLASILVLINFKINTVREL